ncbi:MAG: hypothetical protein GX066_06550 [Clostridiaceae bacterium]|nr:hypothetical protein [Clostridiaceae bacterium]
MIIHSIVPQDIIFSQQKQEDWGAEYIPFKGGLLEVTRTANNKYVINRIHSTCLDTYLDPRFQPGRIIDKF